MKNTKLMEVIILATKDIKALILRNTYKFTPQHGNPLCLTSSVKIEQSPLEDRGYEYNHLYIISEITKNNYPKINDWYIDDINIIRQSITDELGYWMQRKRYKKIEATTDKSLTYHDETPIGENLNGLHKQVPQIPQSFIEAYVKAEGKISEVLVEMDSCDKEDCNDCCNQVKTRPDNSIIIHPSKTYTREEVRSKSLDYFDHFAPKYLKNGAVDPLEVIKWFENNL